MQLLEWAVFVLIIVLILILIACLILYRRIIAMLDAKAVNERRIYVHETGAEAYSFAESMQPESSKAEKLERAVDYMRRQFQQRHIPFDYEQARAVIEKAALSYSRERSS